ncbi:MAG: ATP-binding cassette domain-containing protein [Peptacetobacter hiranonis]|nr:ATP-binding cassette domain-containing protein [Peptacetobacter hiranonis]
MERKRSGMQIVMQLIGLVKPMLPIMIMAILLGVVGFLCAIFIAIMGGYGLLSIIGESSISLKTVFIAVGIMAVLRGALRYGEQASNHYIAFKLLAIIRDKVFKALRKLAPAKLEGKDKGNLISIITSDDENNSKLIECKNVNFAYNTNPDEVILDDVSMNIAKGEIVGISGKSGSGKSTLLKLMMRFFDISSGEINISGINIKDWNTSDLRNSESYVIQDTYLFVDSIKNNVKLANLNASDEGVIEACKKANIHEFIESLPNGYDTIIGEGHHQLSGGERQRIGIARAFLHDSDIILLDEPTSNLDSLNEGAILKVLNEERDKKTIVIVSHRKSTMKIADRVINMNNGRAS